MIRNAIEASAAKMTADRKKLAGILAGRTSVLVRRYKKRKVAQKIISRLSEIDFAAQKSAPKCENSSIM